jgi:hypothetical protein
MMVFKTRAMKTTFTMLLQTIKDINMRHTIKRAGLLCMVAVLLLLSVGGVQGQAVTADPALISYDIRAVDGSAVDANMLMDGSTYLLKLSFQNLHASGSIPASSARVKIGLGSNMILEPGFDIQTAGFNNYIHWSYDNNTSQPQIYANITSAIPAFFMGTASFRVRAQMPGNSTVSGNFLVTNALALSDANPGNNSASLLYTVVAGGPLPVNITKFNATRKGCIIRSEWSVENEINFERYELQASKDGVNYSTIATVPAAGSTDYGSAFDMGSMPQLRAANLLLRLKLVDRGGAFRYSQVVTVSGQCEGEAMYVIYGYPNPVLEQGLNIAIKDGLFNGKYTVTVLDMSGKIYVTRDVTLNSVSNFRLDFGTMLANGKYMITVQQKDGKQNALIQIDKL